MDLIVLVPDVDLEVTIRVLLEQRSQALGIRQVTFQIVRHPRRDPGVRTQAAPILRSFVRETSHALVMLDVSGSGTHGSAAELEREVEATLTADWSNRCAVVAVEPELEVWVWTPSPHVERVLGWRKSRSLRNHLESQGFWPSGYAKPPLPKEAVEHVLWETRTPQTPAIYAEIAERVSLQTCSDPAFNRLRAILQGWFPRERP